MLACNCDIQDLKYLNIDNVLIGEPRKDSTKQDSLNCSDFQGKGKFCKEKICFNL